jgi:hypothetical protein
MHLTNYAINKHNNYEFNQDDKDEDTGHKRNIPFVLKHLKENGFNPDECMAKIKDIIIKSVCSV